MRRINLFFQKLRKCKQLLLVTLMLLPCSAFAAETGANSWEQVLSQITSSLTGPVAYCISIMAVFVSGLTIAFADLQGGAKKFVQVALGLSVALFASQIITGFFHFSGAII